MAVATVNINAVDNMSATLAQLQQQLNNLQQQAGNIIIGGNAQNAQNAFTNINVQARILESTMNRLGNMVWNSFVSGLKDAYQEIKNIDDELVVVRRVTGKTSKELEGMTRNAFEIAQRYGVSASDYLAGVANFVRAGYGDQAESLAELSVQLQRAGDVSANVANQYMTAVDKAYNMQGSVEALTAAMDGANQIGNEYATTVGEIAAGIGKVASIASTGHVGIDELTAALGTITAVTQRSGTEAATALRAIFLNIMGNTQTEIEEGAKWTAGEIEGLRDVLELYAPEVVAAAEATNSLIDPMEAIGALAKSYKDGILTESKLFTMVSDIGGKLRTNQLMVLIKNWDMYESMLNTFANASGSISREIGNSMDSITVKTEQLKAAWVAMVNDAMSTAMIKDFLDGLIGCVNAAGNLQTVLALVLGVVTTLKAQRIGTLFAGMFGGGANAAANIAGSVRGIGLAVTAVATAITAVNGIIQAHNARMDKMAESAQKQSSEAARSSEEITKLYTAYASATVGSKEYETALRALAEALGLTAEQAQNAGDSIDELTAKQLQQAVADTKAAMDRWSSANEGRWATANYGIIFGGEGFADEDIARIVTKYYEAMSQYAQNAWKDDYVLGAGWTLSAKEDAESLVAAYELALEMQKELNLYGLEHGIEDMTDMPGYDVLSGYIDDLADAYASAKEVVDAYVSAVVNAAAQSVMSTTEIAKANDDLADGTADAFSTEEIEAFVKALDDLAESFDQTTFMGKRQYDAFMKKMAEMFPNLIKYSKEYSNWIGKDSADGLADGADGAADSVNRLTQALSTATKAKQAFDAAMENTPKENEGFSDYQSAYAAYAAEIEAGRVNSAIAMAAAKYLMAGSGKYDFADLYDNGGYAAVNAAMKKGPWATVFGDAEKEYGEGFIDLLAKLANKSGQIMDSTGERVIATYKKTGKQVEFSIDDMIELSKVTGLSLDQIWQSVQALGVYGEKGSTGIEGMIDTLSQMEKEAGVTASETGKLSVDYGQLLQFMKDSGKTEGDWEDMKQWLDFLNEIGMIELKNVPEVEEGWQNYKDWAASAAESAEEAAESMGEAKEAAEETTEQTPEVDFSKQSVDAVNEAANGAREAAQAIYDEYNSILSGLSEGDYTVTIKANGDQVWTVTEEVETEVGHVTRTREITFDADGNVIGLHEVDDNIDKGVRTERTVTFNAEGGIETFTEVEMRADDTAHERRIHYRADGTIESIEEVDTRADDTAHERRIHYRADGTIESIEEVDTHADDTAHERIIHYSANGKIEGIEEVETQANDVTHKKEYEFVYGANGELLYAKVREFEVFADGSTSEPVEYTLDADDEEVKKALTGAVQAIADSTEGDHGEYVVGATTTKVDEALNAAESSLENRTSKPYWYYVGYKFQDPVTGEWYTLDAPSEAEMSAEDYYHGTSMGYDRNTGMFVQYSTRADEENGNSEDWFYGPDADSHWTRHVGRETTYDADGNPVTRWVEETIDEAGNIITKYFGSEFEAPVVDFETDPEKIHNMATGASEEAQDAVEPISLEVEGDTEEAADAAKDMSHVFADGFNPADLTVEPDEEDEVTVPGKIELDPLSDEEANQEASGGKPLALHMIPDLGPVNGEVIDSSEDGSYTVYHAKVELEDSDSVVEIFDEINAITGEEHTITIMTEADGTQTVEEYIRELDENGNLVDKTYTTTIDADGNIITTLETAEELAQHLDDMYTMTIQTNADSVSDKLADIQRKVKNLDGKKITITTVVQGDTLPDVEGNARGTDNFRGGLSLINEEGPELIAANGFAKILGHGEPTVANIPKGAKIYTAQETADIMRGVSGWGFPAFKEGTNNDLHNLDFHGNLNLPDTNKDKPGDNNNNNNNNQLNNGGGGNSDKNEFWGTIKEYLEYGLKKIEYSIKEYEQSITLLERARDKILDPIEQEIADLEYSMKMLQYEVTLLERARDDAVKPLDEEINRLKKERDIRKEDEALEEKKLAVEKARADLEEAMHQRTVRYFNEETGQWEWMADQKAIDSAKEALDKAEEDLADAEEDYAITLLERQRDDINNQYQQKIDELEDQIETLNREKEDLDHQTDQINHEYDQAIKPLQDEMELLQQQYDDLELYYNRLVDAVDVPTESLTKALAEMAKAAANYRDQLGDTIALLNTLYELAPGWNAVEMGDLGDYAAQHNTYGNYNNTNNNTNIYIDGIKLIGDKAKGLNDALKNAGLYK